MIEIRRIPIRSLVLAGALAATVCAWAFAQAQAHWLEQGLEQLAAERKDELFAGYQAARPGDTARSYATVVTAARAYVFFGPITGKVSVFSRHSSSSDEAEYAEYAYYYRREEGQWVLTESAMCHDEECRRSAEVAFGD